MGLDFSGEHLRVVTDRQIALTASVVALLAQHFPLAEVQTTCCCAGEVISSSRIRALRAVGAHDAAAALLGAPPPWQMLGAALTTTDIRHMADHKDDHDVWN